MPRIQPLATSDPDLDASVPSTSEVEPAPAVAAPAAPSSAGKTPEQIAKEKRIEELKNESLLAYDGSSPIDGDEVGNYASYFAVALVALMQLLTVSDQRKRSERKGWRSWLRGRF